MSKHTKRHETRTGDIERTTKWKVRIIEFEGIPIREVRPDYYLVDFMRAGHRTRKCFSSLEDAKVYARQKNIEIKNKGTSALTISDKLRVEVAEAVGKLKGRVTITEAVNYWLERHPDSTAEKWMETANKYIAVMRDADRRERSLYDKISKFGILSDELGNPPTCSLDKKAIEDAVDSLAKERGWCWLSKDKYIGAGLTLLRFYNGECKRKRIIDETTPTTWDADFVSSMLHKAEEVSPSIVATLAVMVFAGVRPTEAMRLGWEAVNLSENIISLDGSVTKTRNNRHVTITPNLREWLVAYTGSGNLVESQKRFLVERKQLMSALGLETWPHDVLRHTAATQIYARTHSVDKTCAELGHFGTEMFLRHYKGIAPKPDDVAKFWAIKPTPKTN